MTPIARVVYSPLVQLVVAIAFVAAIVIVMLRPQPPVVVMMPPSGPVVVQQAATAVPVAVFPYCYGWGGSWYGYCRD